VEGGNWTLEVIEQLLALLYGEGTKEQKPSEGGRKTE
jgi:hypothetical protein